MTERVDLQTASVSQLLAEWSDGNPAALHRLMPLIYDSLHRLARNQMKLEYRNGSLQPTALVNEAYLRLVEARPVRWQNRAHFFGIAARVMRQILVDRAREKAALKRGAGQTERSFDETSHGVEGHPEELLALDEALTDLSAFDQRKARVVELRYFGGLEVAEVASCLNVSENTVIRDWSIARAWLRNRLSGKD